ncbi:winged helix-turn-helix domain-containing protein [Acinetobacter sp. ANC 4173]|uniref:winged helix-turn-helix domain-containing protein n=1 Tax=Acinetobacter sp. ANC 4173 TaxID=2529837 RepID=UPI00103F7B13|nr:Lrp/AsnC family transcriptional regulator [Acinetobacter sp. ANC 4173]TCB73758.1 Lrp/AsnC family transcriptional regulator [Acinetobacter sp. ANC 4173]
MSEKNTKILQHALASNRSQITRLLWEQRKIQAQLVTDPEKNKKLYALSQIMYVKVLEEEVDDSTSTRACLKKIQSTLDTEDFTFCSNHKYDVFSRGPSLFKLYAEHPIQQSLVKGKYLGKRTIRNTKTLQQVLKCILEAKIQQQKDMLIAEYKALRKQKDAENKLSETVDVNLVKKSSDRELLILLKSGLNLSQKDLADRAGISVSTLKRRIEKFKELGLM